MSHSSPKVHGLFFVDFEPNKEFLRDAPNRLSSNTASRPRRAESSITSLWKRPSQTMIISHPHKSLDVPHTHTHNTTQHTHSVSNWEIKKQFSIKMYQLPWAKYGKTRNWKSTVRMWVNNYPQCSCTFAVSCTAGCVWRNTHSLCYERGAGLTMMVHFCGALVQYSNTVVSQRNVCSWCERFQNGRANVQHVEGAGLPLSLVMKT